MIRQAVQDLTPQDVGRRAERAPEPAALSAATAAATALNSDSATTVRLVVKYLMDVSLWGLSAPLAFMLRLDPAAWPRFIPSALVYTAVALPVKSILVAAFGLYRHSWRRAELWDLTRLLKVIGLATLILLALGFSLWPEFDSLTIPRSVPLLEGLLAVVVMGSARLVARFYARWSAEAQLQQAARRVLIAGASDAGVLVAQDMLSFPQARLRPLGFVDASPQKQHQHFLGLPVLGSLEQIPALVKAHQVEEVVIALPEVSGKVIRHIVGLCHQAEVRCRIVPRVHETLNGYLSISEIRDVAIEDLLRREPIQISLGDIADYLSDRVVLVTGAGGSIGSEIARQVARFGPRQLLLLGRGENSIYQIERELEHSWPEGDLRAIIADTQDRDKLEYVFRHYRPQVIFHAAAHKHVPMMEANPDAAVFNNIGGTRNLVDLALAYETQYFVNISTDKAVNPTSIMGVTKRVTEYLVAVAAQRAEPGQAFVSVRFGNVLGSRGSVVPTFKEQIRRGGPVTVTHPDMVRYFMTIPEATRLALQAVSLGKSGVVYVLDMGEPLRIEDLARDLIHLSGLELGVDIDIVYTGMRPGERLREELLTAEEGTVSSMHDRIFVARQSVPTETAIGALLDALFEAASRRDTACIRAIFESLVPTYHPNGHYG